jgi:hypothetical protein
MSMQENELALGHDKRIRRIIANVVLFAVLMPYISPVIVPDMDVQLLALAVSIIAIASTVMLTRQGISIMPVDLLILSVGLLSLLYTHPATPVLSPVAWARNCAPLILGFPVYLAVRTLYPYMAPNLLVWIVSIYCGVIIFEMMFPGTYMLIFSHLLSDIRWASFEGRGPNGLCPEPSMMGDMCLLFLVSLYFFHRQYWKKHYCAVAAIVAMSGLMLVLTKSATGLIVALVLLFVALLNTKLSTRRKVVISIAALFLIIVLGQISRGSDTRMGTTLSSLTSNPAVALEDPSLAERLIGVYEGFYQLRYAPLGTGDVDVNVSLTKQALNGDLAVWLWPDDEIRELLVGLQLAHDSNTGLGAMLQRMGILALAIVFALLLLVRAFPGRWVARTFLACLMLNASLFIPTLWFVIGCSVALATSTRRPLIIFSFWSISRAEEASLSSPVRGTICEA